MKKGFSLAEILIAMAVLTVLIAILTPTIMKINPSAEKALARSSYYTISNTVKDLIKNPVLYYHIDDNDGTVYAGFNNKNEVTYQGRSYSSESKFAELFINYLNVRGDVDDDTSFCSDFIAKVTDDEGNEVDDFSSCQTVYTNNGPRWTFAILSAEKTDEDDELTTRVLVDTNGDGRPNCYNGKVGCDDEFDQFRVNVFNDGRIQVIDPWARDAISTSGSVMD